MPVGRRLAAALTRPYEGGDMDAARIVARITAVLSIAAGVIHFSAAGDHTNLPVMMGGFLVVAALQVALGALLLWRRPSRPLLAAAMAMMLASVGIWLVSRTRGIPFLPDGHMEPIGFKDGITVFFELAALPALLLLLSRELSHVRLPSARLGTQAMSVASVVTFALMAPALMLEGGEHHSHEQAVELGLHGHGADAAHQYSESIHAGGGPTAHGTAAAHGAAGERDVHARDGARSHTAGAQHATGSSHSTQLVSFHTGAGGGGHSPGAGGQHRDRDHSGRREGRRGHGRRDHGRARHRDRDRHRGGGKHDRDDGHDGHEDSEPPDDGVVSNVCAIAAAVMKVC